MTWRGWRTRSRRARSACASWSTTRPCRARRCGPSPGPGRPTRCGATCSTRPRRRRPTGWSRIRDRRRLALLRHHRLPAAAAALRRAAPALVRHRHQRDEHQRARQVGPAPLHLQRGQGRRQPPHPHARLRGGRPGPQGLRQRPRPGRLPQRDDRRRERPLPEEPPRQVRLRGQGPRRPPRPRHRHGPGRPRPRLQPVHPRPDPRRRRRLYSIPRAVNLKHIGEIEEEGGGSWAVLRHSLESIIRNITRRYVLGILGSQDSGMGASVSYADGDEMHMVL
ncbi:hypothetical protein VTG60DRAFT_3528 [Thermothelomyces hinnuleus]